MSSTEFDAAKVLKAFEDNDTNATTATTTPTIESKLQLIQSLKSQIKKYGIDLDDVPTFLKIITKGLDINELGILNVSFNSLYYLIRRISVQDRSGKILKDQSFYILPVLINRLGTSSSGIAKKALEDYWLNSPVEVENAVREIAFTTPNSNIFIEALRWIQQLVENIGFNFNTDLFTSDLVEALVRNQKNEDVVHASRDLIHTKSNIPNGEGHMKNLIEAVRKSSVQQRIKENILGNNLRQSTRVLSLETRESKVSKVYDAEKHKIQSQQLLKDGSDYYASRLEDLLSKLRYAIDTSLDALDIAGAEELYRIIESNEASFEEKETEFNWKQREKTIVQLRRFIRGNSSTQFLQDLLICLRGFASAICKGALSLRTTLCTHSCELLKECAIILGEDFDTGAELVFPTLMKLCLSTKSITSMNAHMVIAALFANLPFHTRLVTRIISAMEERNYQPRSYSSIWLQILLLRHVQNSDFLSANNITQVAETADKLLIRLLKDANPKVRQEAKDCYWCYLKVFPQESEKLLNRLDPTTVKALARSQKELGPAATTVKPLAVKVNSRVSLKDHGFEDKVKETKKLNRPSSRQNTLDPTPRVASNPLPRTMRSTQGSFRMENPVPKQNPVSSSGSSTKGALRSSSWGPRSLNNLNVNSYNNNNDNNNNNNNNNNNGNDDNNVAKSNNIGNNDNNTISSSIEINNTQDRVRSKTEMDAKLSRISTAHPMPEPSSEIESNRVIPSSLSKSLPSNVTKLGLTNVETTLSQSKPIIDEDDSSPIDRLLYSNNPDELAQGVKLLMDALVENGDFSRSHRIKSRLRYIAERNADALKPLLTNSELIFAKTANLLSTDDLIRVCALIFHGSELKMFDLISSVVEAPDYFQSNLLLLAMTIDYPDIVGSHALKRQMSTFQNEITSLVLESLSIAMTKIAVTDLQYSDLLSELLRLVKVFKHTSMYELVKKLFCQLYTMSSERFMQSMEDVEDQVREEVELIVGADNTLVVGRNLNSAVFEFTQINPGKKTNVDTLEVIKTTKHNFNTSPNTIPKSSSNQDISNMNSGMETPSCSVPALTSNILSRDNINNEAFQLKPANSTNTEIKSLRPFKLAKSPSKGLSALSDEVYSENQSDTLALDFAQVKINNRNIGQGTNIQHVRELIDRADPLNPLSNKMKRIEIFEDPPASDVPPIHRPMQSWENYNLAKLSFELRSLNIIPNDIEQFEMNCLELLLSWPASNSQSETNSAIALTISAIMKTLESLSSSDPDFREYFYAMGKYKLTQALLLHLQNLDSSSPNLTRSLMLLRHQLRYDESIDINAVWNLFFTMCIDVKFESEMFILWNESILSISNTRSRASLTGIILKYLELGTMKPLSLPVLTICLNFLGKVLIDDVDIDEEKLYRLDTIFGKLFTKSDAMYRKQATMCYGSLLRNKNLTTELTQALNKMKAKYSMSQQRLIEFYSQK